MIGAEFIYSVRFCKHMVTFRYDGGEGVPTEIQPMDNQFRYVADGNYWEIKVDETEEGDLMKWLPNDRIFEIEGLRSRIRQ